MSLINLKEILSTDTDSAKLDKINYNFDQMANRPSTIGPIGGSGASGLDGPVGPQGVQGPQGDIGGTGEAGIAGGSEWTANEFISGDNSTFKIAPSFVYENLPSTIVLGHPDVNSDAFDLINDDAQLKIYKNSSYDADIRFTSVASTDYFDIEYNESGLMSLGFNSGNSSSEISLESTTLNFKDLSENTMLGITSTGITANVDMLFNNSNVNISGSLTLNYGTPAVDEIACSSDASGNIVWKDLSELINTIPIGTIVPILSDILMNGSNFTLNHTYTIDPTSASIMYTGRGMVGSAYEGWYICNGKTWTDGGSISYDTPDLNSYAYDINVNAGMGGPGESVASDNPGQFNVNTENNADTIMSGRRIKSESSLDGSVYDIDLSYVNSSYVNTTLYAGTLVSLENHSKFNITSVPHIVYLGTNNLTWSDSGMVQIKLIESQCTVSYDMDDSHGIKGFWFHYDRIIGNSTTYYLVDGYLHSISTGNILTANEYDTWLVDLGAAQDGMPTDYTLKVYGDSNAQLFETSGERIYRINDKRYYSIDSSGNFGTLSAVSTTCP